MAQQSEERRVGSRTTLARKLDVTPSTIDRWAKRPDFPKAIRIGASPRWDLAEIDQWLAAQQPGR